MVTITSCSCGWCFLLGFFWWCTAQQVQGASLGSGGLEGLLAQLEKGVKTSGSASATSPGFVQTAAQVNTDGSSHGDLKEGFVARKGILEPFQEESALRNFQGGDQSKELLAEPRIVALNLRPPPFVPELSLENRAAQLKKVRDAIYAALGIKGRGRELPHILPFQVHLTPDKFESVVVDFVFPAFPPWLFEVERHRYLLRKENANTDKFKSTYGYSTNDPNKLFVSVWQESSRFSHTWQLLGTVRTPARVAFELFSNNVLDRSLYPLRAYRVISSSAFEGFVDLPLCCRDRVGSFIQITGRLNCHEC